MAYFSHIVSLSVSRLLPLSFHVCVCVCVCVCTCGMGAIKLPSASDSPFSLHPALTHVNSFFFTALSLKLLSGVLLPAETLHLSFFSLLSSEGLDQD